MLLVIVYLIYDVQAYLDDDAVDINGKVFPHYYTALHSVCYSDHRDVAELLLDHGAAIESRTSLGSTHLHLASLYGHASTIKLLLDRGAKVNVTNKTGCTALHGTCYNGNTQCVEELGFE